MALTERLAVIIDAQTGGAVREFNKATSASAKFTKETEQQHIQIGRLKVTHEQLAAGLRAGVATAAISAAYGLARFGKAAVAEAREAAKVGRLTDAVIASTGGVANVTAGHVADLATSLSNMAGVDDEVIQSGENLLLTFTNVRNEVGKGNDVFDQATSTILDMSVALGTDMRSATILAGKALNDPIKGITALTRVGVSFTEQQKDQIRTLVESGKTLEAQKIILGELNREFGGAAKAAADPTERLTVAFGNFEEAVGTTLLPVIDGITEGLTGLAEAGQFVAEHSELKRLILLVGGVASALFVANKALAVYRAVQGAELVQILTRAATGHAAVAAATGAEAAAATTATAAVGELAVAEGAATVGATGLLAKIGAVATGLAGIGVGLGGLKEPVADATDPVFKLMNAVAAAHGDLAAFQRDVLDLGGAMQSNGKYTGITADELKHLADKYGVAVPAADKMAGAEQDVAGAHEDVAQAAEKAREQEQELLDARIASFNAAIAYKRSELDVRDALDAVREAQDTGSHEDYRKAVLDAKDALLGEAQAAVDLARDNREAEGKTLGARRAQQIYRDELRKLAGDLAPGSPLRKYLRGLIDDLDDAAKNRHSTLTVTTYVAGSDTSYAPGTHRRMASGGPVMGPGTETSDSVPILASKGEFVIDAKGSNLADALAYYGARRLASGGPVAGRQYVGSSPMIGQLVVNTRDDKAATSVPRALREAVYVAGVGWT